MNQPDSPSDNVPAEDRDGGSRRQGGGGQRAAGPRIVGRRPGRPADTASAEEARRSDGDEAKSDSVRQREDRPSGSGSRRAPRRRSGGGANEQPAPAEARSAEPSARRTQQPEQPEQDEPTPTETRRRQRAGSQDGVTEALAGFEGMLNGIQQSIDALTERVARAERRLRLGVFVDVPNLIYGAERSEQPINVGKLLDFLSEGRDLVRATAYSPVSDNPQEPVAQQKFVAPFVPYEYRIVTKPLKRFADGSIKGNFDVEMAIDMVTMAERLDVIAIVSGDADFARVVEVIQGRGVRVEVAAFQNSTSAEMRAIADHYTELGAIARQLR